MACCWYEQPLPNRLILVLGEFPKCISKREVSKQHFERSVFRSMLCCQKGGEKRKGLGEIRVRSPWVSRSLLSHLYVHLSSCPSVYTGRYVKWTFVYSPICLCLSFCLYHFLYLPTSACGSLGCLPKSSWLSCLRVFLSPRGVSVLSAAYKSCYRCNFKDYGLQRVRSRIRSG